MLRGVRKIGREGEVEEAAQVTKERAKRQRLWIRLLKRWQWQWGGGWMDGWIDG